MKGQFDGKVAIVTGAGSGIGRASAALFAREGAKVVVSDIDVKGGRETVKQIKACGGEVVFVKADVSKPSQVKALVEKTIEAFGRLDYAHNNAGITQPKTVFTECSDELFEHLLGVNLWGVFYCMKHEIPHMLKQGKGAIVNTASMAGLRGLPFRPAYAASKHGVVGLTKVAALEYARQGIRVNAICPGITNTAMSQTDDPRAAKALNDRLLQVQPLGRMGEPEEIAETVIWLCSDKASFVTGEIMAVAGGWTAQ